MTPPPRLSRARFSSYLKLMQKKHRREKGRFLIEGSHLAEEALRSAWSVEAMLVTEAFSAHPAAEMLRTLALSRQTEIATVTDRELHQLSDTVTSQGIVCVLHSRAVSGTEALTTLPADACVVALDGVADPGNVGTIIRTCDWFGVGAVLLGGNSVELFNPKLLRSAMGSVFHLPVIDEPDLLPVLGRAQQSGWQIWTTAMRGGTPPPRGTGRRIILFGNEARGVSPDLASLASAVISIPGKGSAESLNVAVACGIVLGALSP